LLFKHDRIEVYDEVDGNSVLRVRLGNLS
jgi:hypothetical protein